jgi:hypothetical protein
VTTPAVVVVVPETVVEVRTVLVEVVVESGVVVVVVVLPATVVDEATEVDVLGPVDAVPASTSTATVEDPWTRTPPSPCPQATTRSEAWPGGALVASHFRLKSALGTA